MAQGQAPDPGREVAVEQVRADPFNCLEAYSDAEPESCTELRFLAAAGHDTLGAFKSPSLRGAVDRPPYMHAGQIRSISAVIAHYASAPEAAIGHSELRAHTLTDRERKQIEPFLNTLVPSAME